MCTNCNNNTPSYYSFNLANCSNCSTGNTTDSSYIIYTGPNLPNIDVDSNTNLQDILANINAAIGGAIETNWADFDYHCVGDDITTAEAFVDAITSQYCSLKTDFNTFSTTTFNAAINTLNTTILGISSPHLTSCTYIGVLNADTINTILSKLLTAVCSLNTSINPSGADWNQCYTVSPLPTTITAAFNVIIDQICDLKAGVADIPVLPTFNTIGSCLPSPSATDTLYDVVNKLKTLICTLPGFDIDDLSWTGCITNPNPGGGNDIISAFNQIIAFLSLVNSYKVTTFDPEFFVVTGDSCTGLSVSIQDGVGMSDKFVALNNLDTSPDYLLNKIANGTLITFDTVTTPGKVIINSTAADNKVKADAGDTSSDYLINKVDGKSDTTSAISIVESYNAGTDKVDLTPTIDYVALMTEAMNQVAASPTLSAQWCAINCACTPCTASGTRTVSFEITQAGTSFTGNINAQQTTPSLTYFHSGISLANTTVNTGSYTITAGAVQVQGTLLVTNSSGFGVNYDISVVDGSGTLISDATAQSGNIANSGTLTINPFIYGTSPDNVYKVIIELTD